MEKDFEKCQPSYKKMNLKLNQKDADRKIKLKPKQTGIEKVLFYKNIK